MTSLHHIPDHYGATQRHTLTLASLPHAHFSSYSHSRDTKGQRAYTKRMSSLLKPYSPSTETAAIYHRAVGQWLSYNTQRSNSTNHTPQFKSGSCFRWGPVMETVWIQGNPCKQPTGPPQSQAPLTPHANKTLKTPEGDNGLAKANG